MGDVLRLDERRRRSRPRLPAPENGADILIFDGIRYERAPQTIDLSARMDNPFGGPRPSGRTGKRRA